MTLTPALNGQLPQHVREALPADTETVLTPKNQAGDARMEHAVICAITVLPVQEKNQPKSQQLNVPTTVPQARQSALTQPTNKPADNMTQTLALNGQQPNLVQAALPADTETVQQHKNQAGPAKTESVFTPVPAALTAIYPKYTSRITERAATITTSIGMTQQARYKVYMKSAKIVAQMPVA